MYIVHVVIVVVVGSFNSCSSRSSRSSRNSQGEHNGGGSMCGACLLACLLGNRNYVEQVREHLVVGDARLLVRLLDCLVACFCRANFQLG